MTDLSAFGDLELSRLFRFVLRAKWDPPIDEKAFTPEVNRLIDLIRSEMEGRPESKLRKSVLYPFGQPIDRQNLVGMIRAAYGEQASVMSRFSLQQVVDIGIYPYVLDEAGLKMVAVEAEAMGWPDPSLEPAEKDN